MNLTRLRSLAVSGLVVLSIFTVLSDLKLAIDNWDSRLLANNSVSHWESVMKPVKENLPSNLIMVGYLADWDIPYGKFSPVDQSIEWKLTQYSLAPIAVVRQSQEWIIGNFSSPEFKGWLDEEIGNYKLMAFGFNIYLIQDVEN